MNPLEFIVPIATSAVGAGVSAALSGGGGTATSVAKEPEAVERARSRAIQTVAPMLLDILRSPELGILKYTGLPTLTPPLTEVEQMALARAEDLFRGGLTTPLDRVALERALRTLAMRPSDLLAPRETSMIEALIYGPGGLMEQEAKAATSEFLRAYSPAMEKAIGTTILPEARRTLMGDVGIIRNLLEAQQQVRDVVDWISAIQTLDKLQASAADIARGIGGTAGLLQTAAQAAKFAAIPRARETQRKAAYEDIMKKAIEATMGMLRTQPAGKTTVEKTSGPGFMESFLPRFASGIGSALGQYFLNKPTYSVAPTNWGAGFSVMKPTPTSFDWGGFSVMGSPSSSPNWGNWFGLSPKLPSWSGLSLDLSSW